MTCSSGTPEILMQVVDVLRDDGRRRVPSAISRATARWPRFGCAPTQPSRLSKRRRQASRRLSSDATNSWK